MPTHVPHMPTKVPLCAIACLEACILESLPCSLGVRYLGISTLVVGQIHMVVAGFHSVNETDYSVLISSHAFLGLNCLTSLTVAKNNSNFAILIFTCLQEFKHKLPS